MTCERCGGLSVATHFEGDHAWEYDGLECLICGSITDPLIMTNRDAQAHGASRSMIASGMRPPRGAVNLGRHTGPVRA